MAKRTSITSPSYTNSNSHSSHNESMEIVSLNIISLGSRVQQDTTLSIYFIDITSLFCFIK
jgi:hypothetical protein